MRQVKGQRLRAFVLQGRAPQIVLDVNAKTMPNFKSVVELKGKKIVVTLLQRSGDLKIVSDTRILGAVYTNDFVKRANAKYPKR